MISKTDSILLSNIFSVWPLVSYKYESVVSRQLQVKGVELVPQTCRRFANGEARGYNYILHKQARINTNRTVRSNLTDKHTPSSHRGESSMNWGGVFFFYVSVAQETAPKLKKRKAEALCLDDLTNWCRTEWSESDFRFSDIHQDYAWWDNHPNLHQKRDS